MQSIVCFSAVWSAGLFPGTEYAGPAYAERGGNPASVGERCKREALILCVRAGISPDRIERLFGPPLLTSRFRAGPTEWWYPQLGVTLYWPARMLKPASPAARVRGGII